MHAIVPVRFSTRTGMSLYVQLRLCSGQRCGQARPAKTKWFGRTIFGVTVGFGVVLLTTAVVDLGRQTLQNGGDTWQLSLFRKLPARLLSRAWGELATKELPKLCRQPVLGLYAWAFGCNMEEALIEDIREYPSLSKLFVRQLKENARTVSSEYAVVSPCDGKVLHLGFIEPKGHIEQVKGVKYKLENFLGCSSMAEIIATDTQSGSTQLQKCLYHITIYLAPGDYHHFHSPVDWAVYKRRHFPGELLTVAPWAARKMPGLFTLNERTVLLGNWIHGFFSFAAVGAFNVGSIALLLEEDFKTNTKGEYVMGEFSEKQLGDLANGIAVTKGERLGYFNLGSSIVLVFQAPKNYKFQVKPGDKVYFGQPL